MYTVTTYNQYQHYRVSIPFTLGNMAAHVSSLSSSHDPVSRDLTKSLSSRFSFNASPILIQGCLLLGEGLTDKDFSRTFVFDVFY